MAFSRRQRREAAIWKIADHAEVAGLDSLFDRRVLKLFAWCRYGNWGGSDSPHGVGVLPPIPEGIS